MTAGAAEMNASGAVAGGATMEQFKEGMATGEENGEMMCLSGSQSAYPFYLSNKYGKRAFSAAPKQYHRKRNFKETYGYDRFSGFKTKKHLLFCKCLILSVVPLGLEPRTR